MSAWFRLGAVLPALLACGCGGGGHKQAQGCQLTTPGGPRPPIRALMNFGTPMAHPADPGWYGNGVLWTQLPAPKQFFRTRSGMLRTKMPWFRARNGVVTITGAPLIGGRARFSADVGTPAQYGPTGFAPSDVSFGRTGCWALNARLASTTLRLVMRVYPPS